MTSRYWYAVQVMSGKEFALEEQLAELLGSEDLAYCPRYIVVKKASRHAVRMTDVERPLFSKYLFVRFPTLDLQWGMITDVKHVEGFIRANGYPLPIRSKDIEKIRNECVSGAFNDKGANAESVMKKGDKIRIDEEHYWFGGLEGTFKGLARSHTAKVELSLMGRSTKVEVPTELLARIL